MQKKSLVAWVLVSVLTFGIGGLVWMAEITRDAGRLVKKKDYRTGSTVVLLTIFTFGVYGIYWHYVTALDIAAKDPNKRDYSLPSLLLALFGWGLVGNVLKQLQLNSIIDAKK